MSFSAGKTRHVFKPGSTGFRTVRPYIPPAPTETQTAQEAQGQTPAPTPQPEIPPQRPLPPAHQPQPRHPQGGHGRQQQPHGQPRHPQHPQQHGHGGHGGQGRHGQQPHAPLQVRPLKNVPPVAPVAPVAAAPAHAPVKHDGPGLRGPQVIKMPEPDTVPLPPAAMDPADAPLLPGDASGLAAPASFAEDIEMEEAPQPTKRREPTGREMIINVVEGEEVRIAVVRRGLLEELYLERSSTESHIGNIYKGRVTNVEPSIQAAFIDFGIGKNGFLHISDVHPQYFPKHAKQQKAQQREDARRAAEEQVMPAADAAAAQHTAADGTVVEHAAPGEQTGETNGDAGSEAIDFSSAYGEGEFDELPDEFDGDDGHMNPAAAEKVGRKTPRRARPPIQACFKRGQEVIVQVIKEGIGTKGPTLTSYISAPGRYLVMMPGMAALGVSRKIEDDQQRRELRKRLQELAPPKNLGFIVRTAGMEASKKELQGDLAYLVRMWRVIANRIRTHRAPVELYEESDLVIRTIRDVFNDEIDRIVVDSEQVASRVRDFLSIVDPRSAGIVELYTGTMPIFQKFGVEKEIEKINSRRVEMANGGSLVIDSTEALVAIDVNSGRYRAQRDAELTAFNMNKEAVKEVVRQLRLRDLGGVIVIDFIDMRDEKHKREIERLLRDELKNDRAKTKVLRMSQFCMIELTRQRVRPSLKRSIYGDCPHCHGAGLIKTPESASLDIMRRLAAGATRHDVARLDVRVYPSVANYLLNKKRKALVELEEKTGKKINITSDTTMAGDGAHIEAHDARGNMINVPL